MNVSQFVYNLESDVDPNLVEQLRDWSDNDKLYVYLHSIQLEHMKQFKNLVETLLTLQQSVDNQ